MVVFKRQKDTNHLQIYDGKRKCNKNNIKLEHHVTSCVDICGYLFLSTATSQCRRKLLLSSTLNVCFACIFHSIWYECVCKGTTCVSFFYMLDFFVHFTHISYENIILVKCMQKQHQQRSNQPTNTSRQTYKFTHARILHKQIILLHVCMYI